MNKFTNAIETDNHNHATRGGNIRDFIENPYSLPKRAFNTLSEMQTWYEDNIKYLFSGKRGFISRIESAFRQVHNDGITNLTLSFGINDSSHFSSLNEYVETIDSIQKKIAPDITFIPEISFSREDDIKKAERNFDEIRLNGLKVSKN